jgi:hypothetical protein
MVRSLWRPKANTNSPNKTAVGGGGHHAATDPLPPRVFCLHFRDLQEAGASPVTFNMTRCGLDQTRKRRYTIGIPSRHA